MSGWHFLIRCPPHGKLMCCPCTDHSTRVHEGDTRVLKGEMREAADSTLLDDAVTDIIAGKRSVYSSIDETHTEHKVPHTNAYLYGHGSIFSAI